MNVQQEERVRELSEAAAHWDKLAEEQDSIAAEGNPLDCPDTCAERAKMYRRTAESLRLQIATGVAHCACCLKPVGRSWP